MASTITTLKHLQIPFEDVVKATNNFDENYLLGSGDLGKVYSGELLLSGETVKIAARRLDQKHRQGSVEFLTEISMLSSLKHENIVSLIGFCDENGENIIITKDEATKGSLFMFLDNPTRLPWIQRLKICIGVARALDYIHNGDGRGYSIVHRNINRFTILLDDNLEAKLSGFEYSIKQSVDRMDLVVLSEPIGTKGYMDPAISKKGGVSHKSDIYSFGVVLCEILCGRNAYNPDVDDKYVATLFRNHYGKKSLNDIIPLDLRYQMSQRSLTRFSKAAFSCLNENRLERPQMNDIVVELEKLLELENFIINELEHLKIPVSDIMLATKNFSKACHRKDNNYYNFYIARLEHFDEEKSPSIKEGKNKREFPRRRSIVVIKRLLPREDERGEEVFYTEIKMLHTCKHPNIVKVLGFCDEISEMILVVEHLSNGYLYDYWTHISHMPILTWEKRLKICLDVANALNYLHTEMHDQKMILHRDVNSNCIALDENWVAKFIDFPISVLVPLNQIYEAREYRLGFFCYEDPVIMSDRRFFKRESDVYSFGVILFEFLCGRLAHDSIYRQEHNLGLAFVARRHFQDGKLPLEMLDPILKEESGENNFILKKGLNRYSLEKFVNIAYKCIAENQDQRPTMKVVVWELQKALFSQEEQLQPLDMMHVADKVEESMELKLARKKLEEETQRPNMVQDVDELKKSMEIKLINANSIKKLEHLKIPLSDIKLATQNFSEEFQIRHPGYYNLYNAKLELFDEESSSIKEGKNKGKLPRKRVIVNRFLPSQAQMFDKEFKILVTCKHPNIVKLIGFCNEDSEMILVVEYLVNEYLYDYLIYSNMPNLTWGQRLKICLDVSNALNYLHYEMEDGQSVVHRDIRINNIALDKDWGAKIVNFGYSVFQPSNQDDEALYDETDVHMDPTYIESRKLTRESDVYSFGVLLFEVLCGRLANNKIYLKESNKGLAFVARRRFQEGTLMGMIDHILMEVTDEKSLILKKGPNKASLDKFVKIALKCIEETQDQRPTMKVVAKELQEALIFNMENKDDLIMSLDDIKLATENFHDKNCIGRGGFGNVYIGKVPQGEGFKTIVAKRLDTKHGQGEQQFRTELQILFEYKHENLIPLVGYCDEKNEQIIVYEYASRGSLDRYLKDDVHLTWVKRLNICIDVATALAFLHGGAGKQAIVIHRDIKTANILLNDEWNAMLADFGLSLISPINQETDYVIDHACGTKGYLDPVYLKSGFLTKESDIYSFGVVLFEMMCGKSSYEIFNHKRQYLPGFIKESFEKGKHDDLVFEALKKKIVPKAFTAFQTIAYRCLHDDREKRPTAKEVLKQLKEALQLQVDVKRDVDDSNGGGQNSTAESSLHDLHAKGGASLVPIMSDPPKFPPSTTYFKPTTGHDQDSPDASDDAPKLDVSPNDLGGQPDSPKTQHPRSYASIFQEAANIHKKGTLRFIPPVVTESGVSRAVIPRDLLLKESEFWANTLVGHFIGNHPAFPFVQFHANRLWKKFGLEDVILNDQDFFMFKFKSEQGQLHVFENGPWLFNDIPIMLRKWEPEIWFDKPVLSKVAIWVNIYDLPAIMWNYDILSHLVSSIGVPIAVDRYTAEMCEYKKSMAVFARVLVEFSSEIDFPLFAEAEILDSVRRFRLQYYWLPPRCSHCKIYGHKFEDCSMRPRTQKEMDTCMATSAPVSQVGPSETKDGSSGTKHTDPSEAQDQDGFQNTKRQKRKPMKAPSFPLSRPKVIYVPKKTQDPKGKAPVAATSTTTTTDPSVPVRSLTIQVPQRPLQIHKDTPTVSVTHSGTQAHTDHDSLLTPPGPRVDTWNQNDAFCQINTNEVGIPSIAKEDVEDDSDEDEVEIHISETAQFMQMF